ncbi:ABC transporter permease [Bosea beijingensis]|uniref:ABC transporter permease n=1 Tax=Bosea beijingensis TaxID=3068632 RepID=UPI00274215E6|nr:ABC transporter permease [Bosea sp. REN20]
MALVTDSTITVELPLSARRILLRRALAHRSLVVGSTILFVIVLLSMLAPFLTSADPTLQNLAQRFVPPVWNVAGSWGHPLGTDSLGRDNFARLLYGARISLLVGILTVALSALIGTTLGICAGYFGGRVDAVITFVITVRLALPVTLVALVVVALVGSSLQLLILVIGLLLWDQFAIVSRSATQQLMSREFITAARTIGSSHWRTLLVEILPNIRGPLIVVVSLELAHAILAESALSFLGLGVQPPALSWGLMISEAKNQLMFRPWIVAIPGVGLILLILAINLIGDALRDLTAPEGRAG